MKPSEISLPPSRPKRRGIAALVALALGLSLAVTARAQNLVVPLLDKFVSETDRLPESRDPAFFLLQVQPAPISGGIVQVPLVDDVLSLEAKPAPPLRFAPVPADEIAASVLAPDVLPDDSFRLVGREERWLRTGFRWEQAFRQSMIFLGIQHAFRLATEQGTRADLKGPFFRDYWKALRSLRGWNDADPFIVNYIGHPMMGAASGFIQIQNDPQGIHQSLSTKREYWRSRLKAFGWAAAYSAQFELGLVSEASLGNIGIRPYGKAKHPMAYVDLVVTPVVGTGWLVGEDALDKYLIRHLENRISNRAAIILIRGFLNPTRSFANILRGKWPWFRDARR